MKKFTKFEIFELITILILFVALITNNSVIKEDSITYELSSNKEKNYVAKYIDNEITNCDTTAIYNSLVDVSNTNNILLKMYPVGSIYTSLTNTNPGTIFGGTWIEFGSGRTLVGVDTNDNDFKQVEKIGGEKTHTLTVAELPSHNHQVRTEYGAKGESAYPPNNTYTQIAGNNAVTKDWLSDPISSTGNNQPHNNLQPYITVYMWKRTA